MRNSVTLYRKLRNHLAVWGRIIVTPRQRQEKEAEQPYGFNDKYWELCRVRWMPELQWGYKRLTYAEFCTAYNLEMIPV